MVAAPAVVGQRHLIRPGKQVLTMSFRNLAEILRVQAERLGPRPALRYKKHGLYHDLSWQDYYADARACASALVEAGVKPGDRVGLLSENRVEWLAADMGLLAAGAVNVPPHAPLTSRQVAFELADAGVSWLFVSNREQLDKIKETHQELPALRGVVVFEAADAVPPDGWPARVECQAWAGFLQRGRAALPRTAAELARREAERGPDDLATIMYTSGTTGNPKGVMLTHNNIISNVCATQEVSPHVPENVVLSWLPYSHIYARTVDHYLTLYVGVTLCLAESAETLVQNLADIQPTHMSSVPRFYEKVLTAVASPDRAQMNRRLRRIFVPRIDWLMSGGAPLPTPIAEAYIAAGLLLIQGYGLTETSPVMTSNRKDRYKTGTVGLPLPGVEVKIAPDGEVLTRGPNVMKGYWNNPQATAEAIVDGWFHTGDLGSLDDDGFLSITGRKKELMVLSNGKKVVPAYVEGLLLADECIDQAVVHGEGHNYLTALIVPHWDNVRKALKAEGVEMDHQPVEQTAEHPAVRALLEKRIERALKNVSNWEQIRKFIVLPHPFTVAADELTVSLKLRRNVVLKKYGDRLEALYRGDPQHAAER
jgi:long-chain acyl-CoA synthetase